MSSEKRGIAAHVANPAFLSGAILSIFVTLVAIEFLVVKFGSIVPWLVVSGSLASIGLMLALRRYRGRSYFLAGVVAGVLAGPVIAAAFVVLNFLLVLLGWDA